MGASKEPRLPRTFPNHTEQTSIVLSACACTNHLGQPQHPRMDSEGRPFQEPSVGLGIWIHGQQTALAAEAGLPPEAARDLIFSPYLTIIFPPGHSDRPMSRNSRRLRCTSAPRR
jgi:hypothetical protein